jgi:hypothetical protein
MECITMTNQDLRSYENILAKLISECTKEELADCALLLAMNLANYKSRFGDVPSENFRELLTTDTIDEDTAKILMQGSEEMINTLELIAGDIDADQDDADDDEYESLH